MYYWGYSMYRLYEYRSRYFIVHGQHRTLVSTAEQVCKQDIRVPCYAVLERDTLLYEANTKAELEMYLLLEV